MKPSIEITGGFGYEQMAGAVEAAEICLWEVNLVTGCVILGGCWSDVTGYAPEDIRDLKVAGWRERVHPDDLRAADLAFSKYIDGKTLRFECELRLRHRDRHWVSLLFRGRAVEQRGGDVIRVAGTLVDIVRDRDAPRAEVSLRRSEEQYRALVENSIDTIVRYDKRHRYLYVNPSTEKVTGMKPEDFIGKTHREVGFPEDLCQIADNAIDSVYETGEISRVVIQLPNGIWLDMIMVPELSETKEVATVLTVARDISELKKTEAERQSLEAQLRQSQKLEAVGRLAGGVAHDFNNMLSVIIGRAEYAIESISPDHPLHSGLQEILNAADRSATLTRQLLAFARKQTVAPEVLNLNTAVDRMLIMLQRLIGEDVELAWTPKSDLWPVNVDPSQIDQIMANLCVNSRDAMSGHGKMNIETANVYFDEEYCVGHPDSKPGDFAMIAVSDNGCGMDSGTLKNIFEPFFTTKNKGEGSGLGLSTVYGIVKQNEGFVNVYSEPGKGTTFKIYLPRHQSDAVSMTTNSLASMSVRGDETILLVEDEPAILEIATLMLKDQGYEIIAAGTPSEAVAVAKRCKDPIHLLITDVVMPEMTGRELNEIVSSFHPEMECLYMSGYTANVIAYHGVLADGINFIQKPFMRKALIEKVRKILIAKEK